MYVSSFVFRVHRKWTESRANAQQKKCNLCGNPLFLLRARQRECVIAGTTKEMHSMVCQPFVNPFLSCSTETRSRTLGLRLIRGLRPRALSILRSANLFSDSAQTTKTRHIRMAIFGFSVTADAAGLQARDHTTQRLPSSLGCREQTLHADWGALRSKLSTNLPYRKSRRLIVV